MKSFRIFAVESRWNEPVLKAMFHKGLSDILHVMHVMVTVFLHQFIQLDIHTINLIRA